MRRWQKTSIFLVEDDHSYDKQTEECWERADASSNDGRYLKGFFIVIGTVRIVASGRHHARDGKWFTRKQCNFQWPLSNKSMQIYTAKVRSYSCTSTRYVHAINNVSARRIHVHDTQLFTHDTAVLQLIMTANFRFCLVLIEAFEILFPYPCSLSFNWGPP